MTTRSFDVVVVGAGIIGLGCALAAARLGKRVAVVERDASANGASIRNFGFVTVTGQDRGQVWERARRARDLWLEIAPQAGLEIEHRGLWMAARRPEAAAVLEAFLPTEMGEGCELLTPEAARRREPALGPRLKAALWSPHDLRVDSRAALPRLAAWLEARWDVSFLWRTAVLSVAPPVVMTSRGDLGCEAAIVCPGDDLVSLFPERLTALTRCQLQMLRLEDPGYRLTGALMSDLGLIRYGGYAALPAAQALRARLQAEQADHLTHGVHLIVVQDADGRLVVGDSHHDAATPLPFAAAEVERLILDEFAQVTGRPPPPVVERWTGTYARASDRAALIERPADRSRLVVVAQGNGASTGFALAETVVDDLYERSPRS